MPWTRRSVETPDGYPRKVNPRTLDHVALWVADRHRMAEVAVERLGVRVIEQTDRFTLLGADARRGKLTLFDAEGPRERGPLARIGLRVSSLDGRDASVDLGEGLEIVLVEAETDSELDLDHVALVSADPAAAAAQWQTLGFTPAATAGWRWAARSSSWSPVPLAIRTPAPESSRRPRRLGRGAPGRCGGPRHRDRRPRRRPEHDRALRLGARPGEARVRRAQALVLTHLKDLTVAGAGMAGLVAAARARELGASPVVFEKGNRPGGSMLLSSGVVWRHRSTERLSPRVPGRRPGFAAPDRRRARRRARLARVARSEPGRARDRQPSDCRAPVRPTRTHRRARPGSGGRTAGGALRARQRCSRPEVSAPGSRASAACSCVRTRGARARADHGPARSRGERAGWTSSTAGRCPAKVPENEFVSASQLYARHALVLDDAGADLGEAAWHESDIVQRFPGGVAWYVVDAAALARRLRTAPSPTRSRSHGPRAATSAPADELPFALPASPKLVSLRSRPSACTRRSRTRSAACAWTSGRECSTLTGRRSPACYAAGADAGGIFTGGYGSGLAAALVYGRIAAETALAREWRSCGREAGPFRGLRAMRSAKADAHLRSGELGEGAAAAVAGQRRRADLADAQQRLAFLDGRADRRRLAVALLQRPAARRPDEEDVAGAVCCRSRPSSATNLVATDARCTKAARRGSTCLRLPARPRSGR